MPALSSMLQILCEIDLSLGLEMVDRDMHININSLVLEDGSADKCIPYKYGDLALILRTHEKKTGAALSVLGRYRVPGACWPASVAGSLCASPSFQCRSSPAHSSSLPPSGFRQKRHQPPDVTLLTPE